MEETLKQIENLLIEDDGIAVKLRFQDELDYSKSAELFVLIDKLKSEISPNKMIPIEFLILLLDFFTAVNSVVGNNQNDDKTLLFLDKLSDKIRELNN